MAKKKFDIGATLKKKKDETALSSKIPLKRTAKDPELIKSKVEKIHSDESGVAEKTTIPKQKEVKLVRMTIDTPDLVHKKLKIKTIEMGVSIREYILTLIEKDLQI